MKSFEGVLLVAIEKSLANDIKLRERVYNRARCALNDWFVEHHTPTNERIASQMGLEEAIKTVEATIGERSVETVPMQQPESTRYLKTANQ
ncbi:hypothetical protein ACFQ14_10220 [Pseudahrensia aquimaris]|uniref:Transposase n=1 Tax=Pseudahrensia aquimaris TaxID=744461 RepID=A0ABW3FKW4_9HYPH